MGHGIVPASTDSGTVSQDIALATDDIISASRRPRDTGRPSPVPANCHEDLAARLAVGPGELETYPEPGTLYGLDENGRVRPLE
ncbi:hypothetical protein [Streptomyces sp. NRRL B-24720]|uniref:hypothetical protein n=1 Tax=Streptomyces sp. NRRL B-24720 TaxID=1476876 RepID=UPI0004CB9D1C|nr:hypothetical protein [Streptomyces sp. NRRL B-24720]